MKHLSDALNQLHDDCAWFARAHETRLLVVRVSGDIRKTVIKLLPRYEFHADNRSPWPLLEEPYEPPAALWESRAARLLQDWQRRREAFARDGLSAAKAVQRIDLDTSRATSNGGLALFLSTCVAVVDALPPPLDGLVIILAPTAVQNIEALDADLTELITKQEFSRCRIVLVLDGEVGLPVRTLALVNPAIVCSCVPDPVQKRRDLDVLVESGGDGRVVAGAVPHGVTPPRRINAPPPLDPASRDVALRAAGIDPLYLEHAPMLRSLVLRAALALGDGDHDEGIRLQTEAVRVSALTGMPQVGIVCQIALASYLSAAGRRPQALAELRGAIESAERHGFSDLQAQGYLAQGLLQTLDQKSVEAAAAYRRCAVIAESVNIGTLAIEAWRLAGQAALQAGATDDAVRYLQQGLLVAGDLDPAARQQTSAPEVARRLAKFYADHGSLAQAQALNAQADAIENAETPELRPSIDKGQRAADREA
jgi:hypothetical protein